MEGSSSHLPTPTKRSLRWRRRALHRHAWQDGERRQAYIETREVQTRHKEELVLYEDKLEAEQVAREVAQAPSLGASKSCLSQAISNMG